LAKKGFTRLKAPASVVALSVAGVEYSVDPKSGKLEVSELHVAAAIEHGFVLDDKQD
jgi:hypothetical protein